MRSDALGERAAIIDIDAGGAGMMAACGGGGAFTTVVQVADQVVVLGQRERPVFLQQVDEHLYVGRVGVGP